MTEMTSVGDDFQKSDSNEDKSSKIKSLIETAFKENEEMLERLGSDYDADGTAYWEKYEERLKYMEDNGI